MKPRFSVIIPALNEEKFLPKLLASLAEQTKKDFEVIVVDGRSTDKTVAEAKFFDHKLPSLQVMVSPRASLPLQRNLGAKRARGEWLVFVDADSLLLPYFIDRITKFISKYKPAVFSTWFRPDSENSGDALLTVITNFFLEGSVRMHRPIAPGPLSIVQKKAFDEVGGYDEHYKFGEDADFGRRLDEHGYKMQILRETLAVCSLRRFRKEGTIRVLQKYALSTLAVLLTKRTPKWMPGYLMGGGLYESSKTQESLLIKYKTQLQKFLKEVFE